jgi:hypothetical protein
MCSVLLTKQPYCSEKYSWNQVTNKSTSHAQETLQRATTSVPKQACCLTMRRSRIETDLERNQRNRWLRILATVTAPSKHIAPKGMRGIKLTNTSTSHAQETLQCATTSVPKQACCLTVRRSRFETALINEAKRFESWPPSQHPLCNPIQQTRA